MCSDADHRKELGRNAIDRVHEQFTWTKVARSIAALYEDVAAGTVRHVA
jgi:glycosyltransferase involved in cell wall biosynthesis